MPRSPEPAPRRSFDVFDTVLTRRTGRPAAVFDLVADRLLAAGRLAAPAGAFTAARVRAEPRLHTLSGRPPRLREVYEEVAHVLALPAGDVALFVETEQDVERALSVAVPGAARLLDQARAETPDGLVVFVSDTPHTGDFVRELLQRQDLLVDGDRVFSSADMGASKSRGGLFTAVGQALALPGSQLSHTGDNRRADVARAQAEGWSGVHRPEAALDRYEKLLDARPGETAGFGAWLAGSSRLARLRAAEAGVSPAVAEVAAGVAAPVLISYALWLAAQARARGLTRLYFVARDGQVLLETARPVLEVLAPEVECRYLHGSRQAWVLAAGAVSDEVLSSWLVPKPDSTARTALARAGLDAEHLWRATGLGWAAPDRADRVLSEPEAARLSAELQREPLRSRVLEAARESLDLASDYVRQEGFAETGHRSALVDLGWRGHSARAFDALVRHVGGAPVEHLFLGLYSGARLVRQGACPPVLSAWLFDRDRGRAPDPRRLERPNVVLEMFCAGTEGRTLGYRREGTRVVPVLSAPVNGPVLDWGLQDVRDVIADVVQGCCDGLTAQHLHVDLAGPAWDVLQAFWSHPTSAEAAAWGSFPWEEESYPPVYRLAGPLPPRQLLRRLAPGRRALPFNSWRAGSAQLQREPWRSLLLLSAWSERRPPLRRLPGRLRHAARRRLGG